MSAGSCPDLADLWILDMGASDHVTCSLKHFISYKPVKGVNVFLSDSSPMSVSHVGSVKLPHGQVIHNVLCVPTFHFNLVSVSKLTSHLPVSLIFQSNKCQLQDLTTGKMIGLATQTRGLYHL